MTSQPGKHAIAIRILPSISRRQSDNEILSINRINIKNIFHRISYTKYGGETIPRPFSKKSKLSVFLDQYSKVLYSLLLLYAKLRAIDIY